MRSGETTQDSAAAGSVAVGAASPSKYKETCGRSTRTWSQHGLRDLQSKDTVIRQQYCREGARETESPTLLFFPPSFPCKCSPPSDYNRSWKARGAVTHLRRKSRAEKGREWMGGSGEQRGMAHTFTTFSIARYHLDSSKLNGFL